MRVAIALLVTFFWAAATPAHEVRPSYLELRETGAGEYDVLWKTPMLGEARLAIEPAFPAGVEPTSPVVTRRVPGAAVQTWTVRADALRGERLRIRGLEGTMTDALVRIEFADGASWTQRLTPSAPAAVVPAADSALTVAAVYLKLGVEHILLGIDHLLFVLALVFIARGAGPLVKTITAFTVAHSITLGLATLGFVHVPPRPVEALIALSIAFVAAEIVRGRNGRQGIAWRAPWVVAFAFGLLHGFGFAGALSEVGLPATHVPLALAFFNIGVEIGQLVFVAGVLGGWSLLRRAAAAPMETMETRASPSLSPQWTALAPAYLIGIVSMFWVVERVAAF